MGRDRPYRPLDLELRRTTRVLKYQVPVTVRGTVMDPIVICPKCGRGTSAEGLCRVGDLQMSLWRWSCWKCAENCIALRHDTLAEYEGYRQRIQEAMGLRMPPSEIKVDETEFIGT